MDQLFIISGGMIFSLVHGSICSTHKLQFLTYIDEIQCKCRNVLKNDLIEICFSTIPHITPNFEKSFIRKE
uniref:Hypothetical secreted peptide n=1 Tax=Glossina morsitans morsitans TaxID=37546 RepID=D3TSK6_GLOMM